ncbi:PREDICTED: uncharacterized protein LOC104808263 [Tarenaya hassleriana]|uniref:uncharacterized protein LOC104808263 n=1 Tax=Tarenaya hassleriana TaxID=28532 RepID=UPI00053C67AD|nr:PREDICTED: uncharacterized protein LOC104808263 [Tarenaya hassleriana]
MGCGGSRMGNAGGDEVSARIRPLLRRRLEEMKKRSHASVLRGNQTLSKKELLKHGGSDGEETEHDGSMRSAKVAPAPSDHDEVNNEEVVYEEVVEKVIEVVKEQRDDGDYDDHGGCDDGHGHDVDGDHHEEEDEEEEIEGRMSNFDERMICPASPSFKVYCIDISDSDDDEHKDKYGEEKKSSKTENSDIVVDPKDQSIKTAKNGRKGRRRFSIPLPKAATPKKYLFNVASPCYSAAAGGCMGNHHSRLVQEKSSTN